MHFCSFKQIVTQMAFYTCTPSVKGGGGADRTLPTLANVGYFGAERHLDHRFGKYPALFDATVLENGGARGTAAPSRLEGRKTAL